MKIKNNRKISRKLNGDNKIQPEKHKSIIFKLGELFCGPGGLALGAINAKCNKGTVKYKFEHAWASDYDPDSERDLKLVENKV